jgi:hypothetical protein
MTLVKKLQRALLKKESPLENPEVPIQVAVLEKPHLEVPIQFDKNQNWGGYLQDKIDHRPPVPKPTK